MAARWLEEVSGVRKLRGAKILITGPTSQVAFPLARALAGDNDVHGLARFKHERDRARVEAIGVTCWAADLASDSLDLLPNDFDYVLNFAVVKSGDFDYDLAANAEGAGRLMSHCHRRCRFGSLPVECGGGPTGGPLSRPPDGIRRIISGQ